MLPSKALEVITQITELLVAGNAAVPLIFATVKLVRDLAARDGDPEVPDSELINIMEAALQRNSERNRELVREILANQPPVNPSE